MSITSATDGNLLKITDPGFSAMGEEIRAARKRNWYARTNYGIAVLRHGEVGALLKDRRLRQGSWSWPAQNGITDGVLSDWWKSSLVGMEGEDHARIRKLVNPAFSHSVIATMTESFRELAHDVIDQFADSGACEFMTDFAEPYSSRALCRLLALPEEDWRELTQLSADMGLAFGPEIAEQRATIEAAILALYARADELVAQRRIQPTEDFVSQLVIATDENGDRLSDQELRELITSLIFGGMDTTRSQLGLMMQPSSSTPINGRCSPTGRNSPPRPSRKSFASIRRSTGPLDWPSRTSPSRASTSRRGRCSTSCPTPPAPTPRRRRGELRHHGQARPHFGFGGGRHHCLGHFVARLDIREALQAFRSASPSRDSPPRPAIGHRPGTPARSSSP